MKDSPESSTSISLIERIRLYPVDERAWGQFVERYGRRIFQWCQRWNLQQADAEDVTQIVLLKLADKMRTFSYDPERSFRGWLKTVTHHAWRDYVDKRRGVPAAGNPALTALLDNQQAPDDLDRFLEEEHRYGLLEQAMQRVQERVERRTWEAFRLQALEQRPVQQVVNELGMSPAAAFMAKSRVQALLRQEVQRLEGQA